MSRTRIKLCGMTRPEDVRLAVGLGADALGFVCWKKSPRYVSPAAIARMTRDVPIFVHRVGVFVNADPDEIVDIVEAADLTAIQLHGDEDPMEWAESPIPVIKAVGVGGDFDGSVLAGWPAAVTPLLDAADKEKRGGTGETIDWDLAAAAARNRPVILAGGLTPENVEEAIVRVRPFAIDVSSGVERAPGVKDPPRLRAFMKAVHRADNRSDR